MNKNSVASRLLNIDRELSRIDLDQASNQVIGLLRAVEARDPPLAAELELLLGELTNQQEMLYPPRQAIMLLVRELMEVSDE